MSVLEKGQERLLLVLQEMPIRENGRHISALRVQEGGNMIAGIVIGVFIGGMIGVVTMCILFMGKDGRK